jgi:uncharacterized membrane protein YgdD (TMEM256/DUF423 family)
MPVFVLLGALLGLFGVGLGAFGAHVLKPRIGMEALAVYQTGVQYHLVHALALLVVGLLPRLLSMTVHLRFAGWFFLAGVLLFSGSLYLLAVTGQRWLGAITPFGGVAFLVGWALIAAAALKGS